MKKSYFLLLFFIGIKPIFAQVGINTTTPNAQLEIKSSDQTAPSNTDGILIPKVDVFPATNPTAAQQGMLVYLTTTSGTDLPGFYYWDNPTVDWISIGNNTSNNWRTSGNSGTNSGTNFIGTTDNQSFILKTNNIHRAQFSNSGKLFYGNDIPLVDNWANFSKTVIGTNDTDNDFTLRSSGADIPAINILRSNGAMKTPSLFNSGELGSLRFWRYTGVGGFDGYNPAGRIASIVSASGTALHLSGGINSAMVIKDSGSIGIGVSDPQETLHVLGNIRMVDGNQATGKILTSDANGTASWTNPIGIANGSLDQAYNFGGAGNGKTITADAGAVIIDGTDGFVSTGTTGVGAIAPSGAGTRMVWNPRKAAFRVGQASGTSWDDVNVGNNSVAMGFGTRASGSTSIALGSNCLALGLGSVAIGWSANANATQSTAFGLATNANSLYSTAFGYSTTTRGDASVAIGVNNETKSFGETALGIGATLYTPSFNGSNQFRTANANDRLLVVGNAIDTNSNDTVDSAERSDALVILKNGNTGIGTSTPQETLHVIGKIRMVDGSQSAGKVLTCDANGTAVWNTLSATNAWGLGGNIGTTTATNFIGTTDNNSLAFRTNNTEKARILTTGEFGIGTTTPDRKLEVSGTGTQYARITSTSSLDVGIELKRSGSDWQMRNDTGDLVFAQSNDDLATVTDVVRVGGGSFTPVTDNLIQLGQNSRRWLSVHAVNGVIQTSDANDKKEMLPLSYGLEKIKSLRPISFQWKDTKIDNSSTHLGFVAQEVQQVLPEVVVDHDWKEVPESQEKTWEKTEKLGMKYAEIIPVLVKAVQEQQVIIEELKAKIEALEKK
jgi:hypothetical protein